MKILFVHHGNRLKGNPPSQNDDMTKLGYEDCHLVAKLVNNDEVKSTIKCIVSSPIFRCAKTAEIINQNLSVPIVYDNRLDEANSVKDETWVDVQQRVQNCINDLDKQYKNNDLVICVTSGVNLGAFMCKAFDIPISENTPFLGVPSCSPILFDFNKKR